MRHPYLKRYISEAWELGDHDGILDLIFGLEFQDEPTTH